MKKIVLIHALVFLLSLSFLACEDPQEVSIGNLDKPIAIASVQDKGREALLILDNKKSQLFLYDVQDKCYLDFSKQLPLNNGLTLPKYPYLLQKADNNKKAITLSSNKTLSIVDLMPYYNYYQANCQNSVYPDVEFAKQLSFLPGEVLFRKAEALAYEIALVDHDSNALHLYKYETESFVLTSKTEFNGEILKVRFVDGVYYLAIQGEKGLTKLTPAGEVSKVDILDLGVQYTNIDDFIIEGEHVYFYSKYENRMYVWNMETASFEDIPSAYNPIDTTGTSNAKSLKLRYKLTSMTIYEQKYSLADNAYLNGLGYLKTHQLLEGKYLLLTDVGGYFYFLTINSNTDLMKNFPSAYESLDDYKAELDKKYLAFQIPLQTDYKAEVISMIQPEYCTQFNKKEADSCFYTLNEEENNDNRFIMINEDVKNRKYDLTNDYFRFTYEGALSKSLGDDGSFVDASTFRSESIDFQALNLQAKDIYLDVVSKVAEEKLHDEKCSVYNTTSDPEAKTNRANYRLIPVEAINGHQLTLNTENHPNLAYCYEEAFVFQIRLKNLFLVSTTQHGEIGQTSYCTTKADNNPFCDGTSTLGYACPEVCSEDTAPVYENELFKVKVFSDKGEMSVDSRISFSFGVTSTQTRYRNYMISPLSVAIYKQADSESAEGIAILDSYKNEVYLIDTISLNAVTMTIQ